MCVEQIHEMKSNPKREEGDPRKGEKRVRVKRNQRRSVFINNTHKAAQRIKYRDRSLVHSSEDGGAVGKGECCLQPEPSKCLVEPLVLRPHSKQNAVRQFPQTIWLRLFFLMWTFLQFGQSRPVAMLDFLSRSLLSFALAASSRCILRSSLKERKGLFGKQRRSNAKQEIQKDQSLLRSRKRRVLPAT